MLLDLSSISKVSYPDFIALMNQDNTPPGGIETLNYWITKGKIHRKSTILDLACSTGFSSRYCFQQTGAKSIGIDTSIDSINVANNKAREMGAATCVKFLNMDACKLTFENEKFTHVLAGCNFAFIQDRSIALDESLRTLSKNGAICVSNFYYRTPPPNEILEEVRHSIGFKPSHKWTYEYWLNFFQSKGLKLSHEHNYNLASIPETVLHRSIEQYIHKENTFTSTLIPEFKNEFFQKFYSIKKTLNSQRNYQGVSVQIWHKP